MKFQYLLVSSLLVLAANFAQAQVVSQRIVQPRLYHQNYFYLNPAFAGSEGRKEIGINAHLNSLSSKSSTAPLSVIGYYHGTVGDTTRNGLGVVAVYDQFGPFWLGKLGLAYARRFRLGAQSSLAIGTQLSAKYLNVDLAEQSRINGGKLMVGHDNDLRPDVDMGLWLNIRSFYAGATFANLLEPNYNILATLEREDIRELFVTAGYKFSFGNQLSVTPSFFMDRPLKDGKSHFQYSALANVKFLVAGVTYRGQFDQSAPWNVNAGVNIKDNVQLLTSFDLTKEVSNVKADPQVEASLRIKF